MISILKEKSNMISKLFVYQVAMSLLGLFVVSPFSGKVQIAASVFASLFYFSLVCYAIIEDGQKDFISHNAGRICGSGMTGFVYAVASYIPTIVIVILQVLLCTLTKATEFLGLKSILTFVIRFFLMGMYLGIDTGLVQRGYDSVNQTSVVLCDSKILVYMSDNYLIFALCLVLFPIVAGVSYNLAFKGKVHVNTAPKNKK